MARDRKDPSLPSVVQEDKGPSLLSALTLAALYHELVLPSPVDELLSSPSVVLGRYTQVSCKLLELIDPVAFDKVVELLVVYSVRLVVRDKTLHCVWNTLRRYPDFQSVPKADVASIVVATQVSDIRRYLSFTDLYRRSVETYVCQVVVTAAIRQPLILMWIFRVSGSSIAICSMPPGRLG